MLRKRREGDKGPTSEDEGALCGNPMGCDDWLNRCRAKGGTEETQPGGFCMCCRSNSSGKECISDPDAWPARRRPSTSKPVATAKAP